MAEHAVEIVPINIASEYTLAPLLVLVGTQTPIRGAEGGYGFVPPPHRRKVGSWPVQFALRERP